jgi:hypothetical protein
MFGLTPLLRHTPGMATSILLAPEGWPKRRLLIVVLLLLVHDIVNESP